MAGVDAVNPTAPSPQLPLSSHAGGGIRLEDLKRVDISQLSQSELQALSLCSDSAFDVRRTDDVVSPQLDRSLFNESAGSRRQTYSRLHHRSHSRIPSLHPSLKPHHHPSYSTDPVSHSIVHFLKHLLSGNHNPPPPVPRLPLPLPPSLEATTAVAAPGTELGFLRLQEKLKIKRKRGRKSKNLNKKKLLENGVGTELHLVNGKGEVVDISELEKKGDDLYTEELKGRTVGLDTEEGVLGFLWGLEGQWCSRRKKRKYVDADLFGDALPVGWKLLLGLRRRDYRVSIYCRRYVSPSGQQFLTCKEAASFLKSYFGDNGANQQMNQRTSSIQQPYMLSFEKNARPADEMDGMAHAMVAPPTLARNSSNSQEIEDCLLGIENLPDVQVKDIFECVKCKLTFDEKNTYLQHLFSFHQRTTKRYKFGAPVGEGVIIKDGKFECQFCHKIFEERRSYNGHVGVHVRNSGKIFNELATSANIQENAESPVSSTPSKLDALEIAQPSTFENPTNETDDQAIADHSTSVLNVEGALAASGGHEANLVSNPVEIETEGFNSDRALGEDLIPGNQVQTENSDTVRDDCTLNVDVKVDAGCVDDSEPAGSGEQEKYESNNLDKDDSEPAGSGELEKYESNNLDKDDSEPAGSGEQEKYESNNLDMDFDNGGLKPSDVHVEDTQELTVGEIVFQDGVSSVPLTEPFQFFPPFDSESNKGGHEFSLMDQKLENVTDFEELRFDDLEPFKYGFVNDQDLQSLPGGSMNLGDHTEIEDGFNHSVRFGSEELMLNTFDTNQLTVCVWCRTEFKLEGIEAETPSDSIGYMCPTCKAKISGHFGGGMSIDPQGF